MYILNIQARGGPMQIGERIRQLRIHKRLTQGELVSGICSVTYLSRIENGQIKPSYSFLQQISPKLDIDINFLVEIDATDLESEIIKIYKHYKETNSITDKEISMFELAIREIHSIPLLLMTYGTLIYYHVRNNKLEYAEKIINQALQIIPRQVDSQYNDVFIYYLMACGSYFYYKQDHIKANEIYTQADYILEAEDSLQRADLYYNLSLVKQRLIKNQSMSRLYSKKAYDIYTKLNVESRIVRTLITIGVQYHRDGIYEKALEYLRTAEINASKNNDLSYLSMIEYNYGIIYQGLRDYSSAIKHFEKSIELSEFLPFESEKAYTLRSLIEIYLELRDWEKVNTLMDEAFKIVAKNDFPYVNVQLYKFKASIFKLRGDYYGYEKEMQKAIELAKEKVQYLLLQELCIELANYFYENRAYKMSAKYFRIATECSVE